MSGVYLIKIGEIGLKKGNRPYFERLLKQGIRQKLPGDAVVTIRSGRFYLETGEEPDIVSQALRTTPGIVAFARAFRVTKDLDSLEKASVEAARDHLAAGDGPRFKFEVRRTDKGLPLDSYGYARELGDRLVHALPELQVDVQQPDWIIHVEMREWGYVYGREERGPGGLPVGSAGRGLLLLSGGLDSPVAGYLMAKRGMRLRSVHFHTPPYTSPEAHDKVKRLAELMAVWTGGMTLLTVPFTAAQIAINKNVVPDTVTLHTRAAMMRVAERLARRSRSISLITGEALGQVASQTQESIRYTDSATVLPVLRPLIGLDKEEIITLARSIGTYETSVLPFDDCCTLFSPEHPNTRPNAEKEKAAFAAIPDIEKILDEATEEIEETRWEP